MKTILILFVLSIALAWVSEQHTAQCLGSRGSYSPWEDPAFLALVAVLTLFAGLRTQYNDTWNYTSAFRQRGGLAEFLENPENLNPVKNPLYYLLEAVLRDRTDNPQVLIFLTSAFAQVCFALFFKRYSRHFTFTVFLYFTLGTFCVSLAAIKQILAMALLTLALPALERRQWGRYLLLVAVASLIHTYAVAFAVLPLLRQRPWTAFTFLFVGLTVFVLMNFREVIEEFMEQANALGKNLAEYEVFDKHTINLFRLGVYAVPPLLSLCFARWVNYNARPMDHLFVHMSILSLAAMSMGTQAGANMFARMAHYFELGTLICLPDMLERIFESSTFRLVAGCAAVCYFGFFAYANRNFDSLFQGLGILGLF